jgi:hypothetical protein
MSIIQQPFNLLKKLILNTMYTQVGNLLPIVTQQVTAYMIYSIDQVFDSHKHNYCLVLETVA